MLNKIEGAEKVKTVSHENIVRLRRDIINAIENRKFIRLGGLLYRVLCASCILDKPIVVTYSWIRDALLALSNGPIYDPLGEDNELYHKFNPCDACFADRICNYMTIAMILLYSNLESADESKLTVIAPAKKTLFNLFGKNPDWTTFHNRTFEGMFSDACFSTDLNYTGEIFRVLAERCKFIDDPVYNETIETHRLGLSDGVQLRYEGYRKSIRRFVNPDDNNGMGDKALEALEALFRSSEQRLTSKMNDAFKVNTANIIDEVQIQKNGGEREFVYRLWGEMLDNPLLSDFNDHASIFHHLSSNEPPVTSYAERIEDARQFAIRNGRKGAAAFWRSVYKTMRERRPLSTLAERRQKQKEAAERKRTIWSTEKGFDKF